MRSCNKTMWIMMKSLLGTRRRHDSHRILTEESLFTDSYQIHSHTHRVMAASQHLQHWWSQLWEKSLGHLDVFCVSVCVCVCTRVRVRLKCGWGDWGAAFTSWCSQELMTVWELCALTADWISGDLGLSYLPFTCPLPLPSCHGIIRWRFMERTAWLAWWSRRAGRTCWENIIGHFQAASLSL